jgi:hypothetical protein
MEQIFRLRRNQKLPAAFSLAGIALDLSSSRSPVFDRDFEHQSGPITALKI